MVQLPGEQRVTWYCRSRRYSSSARCWCRKCSEPGSAWAWASPNSRDNQHTKITNRPKTAHLANFPCGEFSFPGATFGGQSSTCDGSQRTGLRTDCGGTCRRPVDGCATRRKTKPTTTARLTSLFDTEREVAGQGLRAQAHAHPTTRYTLRLQV